MWVAAAAPVASRGALPTVLLLAVLALPALLALPARAGGRRGLVAGLEVCYEPVARLAGRSASVAGLIRLS